MKPVRDVSVAVGRSTWLLTVTDTPRWARMVESAYGALMTALGSPCCDGRHGTSKRSWAGWIYDHLPDDLERDGWSWRSGFQVAQYKLLSNRVANAGMRRQTRVLDLPILASQAALIHPEFVAENDHFLDDVRAISTPTLTISNATSYYTTT